MKLKPGSGDFYANSCSIANWERLHHSDLLPAAIQVTASQLRLSLTQSYNGQNERRPVLPIAACKLLNAVVAGGLWDDQHSRVTTHITHQQTLATASHTHTHRQTQLTL